MSWNHKAKTLIIFNKSSAEIRLARGKQNNYSSEKSPFCNEIFEKDSARLRGLAFAMPVRLSIVCYEEYWDCYKNQKDFRDEPNNFEYKDQVTKSG